MRHNSQGVGNELTGLRVERSGKAGLSRKGSVFKWTSTRKGQQLLAKLSVA